MLCNSRQTLWRLCKLSPRNSLRNRFCVHQPLHQQKNMNTATIVQKLWNYCNVLRDDGMSYGDYVEQLTYLLFLKMADERGRPPYNQASPVLAGYGWPSLVKKDGDELFDHYRHTLEELGKQKGLLGLIFNKWHGGTRP